MKKKPIFKGMTLILAVCILMSFIFAGCGGSSQKETTSGNTGSTETTSNNSESSSNSGKSGGITVRYICLVKGIPYFDPIIQGMKDSVEAAGGTFQETAPVESDATAQIPLIEAAIQDKVDVICISPSSADALNTALDKARQNGIKVLCVNDDLVGNEDHRDGAVLSTNYIQLAKDSFEAFAKAMNYKGNFVVLSSKTDTPFQNQQIEIYKQMMAEDDKYKDMKLLEVLYGNDEATKSLTESEAAIQKYPELDGIIAPTSVAIVAAAQAVENAGLKDKITVVGLGTPSQCKDFIKSGVIDGALLWDTYRTGHVAGTLSIALAKGEVELKPGNSFEAGEYGKTDIGENNIVYAGPPLVFSTDNVDDYDF